MKTIASIFMTLFLLVNFAMAQDELYIYKGGAVLYKQVLISIDSITFKNNTTASETVTDIDGNVYHTVKIGKQTWMVENLKTTKYRNGNGGTIPNVINATDWPFLSTGAYCNYNNDEDNGLKYGRLYNGYAVTDVRNLAPAGWHVATDTDWTILIDYLIANGYNYDGTKDDNRVAKSLASPTDWTTYVGPGAIGNDLTKNNSTGFSALPGGYRSSDYPSSFVSIGFKCSWWSCTTTNDTYGRSLEYNSSYAFRDNYPRRSGLYVRCVKD
ncbi:MAG: fibrobacter succinogenes major paralogous domain-containing protein [Bacteroidales bacterium]|nr:fibrobacter succinogenes major paralogous domain-containing protein [Bacteroidales bacterium]